MKSLKFKISFVALLLYELTMIVTQLEGLSFFKLLLTGFVWGSFGIAFVLFFKKYEVLKRSMPRIAFLLLQLLFIWNVICIIRSLVFKVGTITTLFGNVYTALALLLPFVIIYSIDIKNLKVVNFLMILMLQLGFVTFIPFLLLTGGLFTETQVLFLFILFQPVVFLITQLPFQNQKNKIVVLVGAILLAYVALLFSNRTTFIREAALFMALIPIALYRRLRYKWVLGFSFLLLLIPFVLLQQSIATGESAFETYLSPSGDDEMSMDTRTFLYIELYEDLFLNNQLLVGKSANGKYYSEYFSSQEGDAEIRLDIEVGVLAMLLKGGFIAVILNLMISILAIFYAFFRSHNTYVLGAGFMLLIHTVLLFIDNRIGYTSYNFLIWLFIGVCLSKEIRHMNNVEIRNLLRSKRKTI